MEVGCYLLLFGDVSYSGTLVFLHLRITEKGERGRGRGHCVIGL